ncbi:MAG: helix-turn-helix transcriptional regulator [Bacteroidota bacterium]
MAESPVTRLKTIADYHRLMGLPKPEHPLISVINYTDMKRLPGSEPVSLALDFYSISLKRGFNGIMKYGQQEFDFDSGVMTFMSPGQVFSISVNSGTELKHSGWLLFIHPDFLWNAPILKKIKHSEYFSYAVNEALHLSDKEEGTITGIMQNMAQEYHSNIDNFSQNVIIAQLELLLSYAERFYNRQFITRKISNHSVLDRLEDILTKAFTDDALSTNGIPTVQFIADSLNVSPGYLSSLLKVLTGQSTQQHIHNKLIDTAKEKLSVTALSVSEIAYELGFEHPQSFSKLFKTKMKVTPLEFRQSFN